MASDRALDAAPTAAQLSGVDVARAAGGFQRGEIKSAAETEDEIQRQRNEAVKQSRKNQVLSDIIQVAATTAGAAIGTAIAPGAGTVAGAKIGSAVGDIGGSAITKQRPSGYARAVGPLAEAFGGNVEENRLSTDIENRRKGLRNRVPYAPQE